MNKEQAKVISEIFENHEKELKALQEVNTKSQELICKQAEEIKKTKKWGMYKRDDAHKFNTENKVLKSLLKEVLEVDKTIEIHGEFACMYCRQWEYEGHSDDCVYVKIKKKIGEQDG